MFSYNIIGTGAVGGYYGGRLSQSGRDVRFLARSDADEIRKHGLIVDSVKGDFILPEVPVFTNAAGMPAADVVVVSTKSTGNGRLPEILEPLVSPGTIVLMLQNGLGMEEELAARFPEAIVVGGMCFICAQKRKPARISHLDYGEITFAAFDPRGEAVLEALKKDFEESLVPITLAASLGAARWRKLLWNIPYNGMSVLLGADTKTMMDDPSSRAIIRRLMEEVAQGAASCGFRFDEGAVDKMLAYTDGMKPYEPSMKLDFDYGHPMEIEYMYRNPIAEARKRGCVLPAVSMLADLLEFRQRRANADRNAPA